ENDPTTLFTSSGMQPLVPYLLGENHPLGTRLVDSQKAFRAQDIEEVGDNRHTTFFEMLGNWSLGDYFKKEQLTWFFEFLTEILGLPPEKLYVTVFEGNTSVPKDTESITIWKDLFAKTGIKAEENGRIFLYPAEKNWWSRSGEPEYMPPGEPGGPDSEVFFEFTDVKHDPSFGEKCHPNCDCGRFLEIGNSVFMQYQKQADGSLKVLPKKNVDFGGGLERLLAAVSNDPDIFNTDLFKQAVNKLEQLSGKSYQDKAYQKAMRIVADHIKASVFMLNEGIFPSNKQQGYLLRRLIRRSVVKMHELGNMAARDMGKEIYRTVGEIYKDVYLDPGSSEFSKSETVLLEEISKFEKNLSQGTKLLEKHEVIDAKIAFDMLQTFGFPWELTVEMAKERGQEVDMLRFKKEFTRHQELSRTAAKGMFKGGLQNESEMTTKLHTATHLLQQSLRELLGNEVRQKGSNISAERLRFDFSYEGKLDNGLLKQVEEIVNRKIKEKLPVSMEVKDFVQAVSEGALTVPGANYPDKVKVYSIGTFSKEVCGGPHIDSTKDLGKFKIIKEEGVSSGVRRIYAVLEDDK
ncbi:MAG: alanyl-tRNA synthetase, partial [Candidatus Gottesmanbacteria bacterium GW2011_GWC2_39_8]